LGHHYFAQKSPCTSQIKFKGIMAPTVPKFGLTLWESADGTAGVVAGSPAAAKHQKTAGEYKISNGFWAMPRRNPACRKGNELVRADIALDPLNVSIRMVTDATKTADPMAPLNITRLADAAKAADLIPSDNNNSLLDLEITPAAKPTTKPIVVPPLYKRQDLDIDRRNRLNRLHRLDEL
jgi:hypothetical protein